MVLESKNDLVTGLQDRKKGNKLESDRAATAGVDRRCKHLKSFLRAFRNKLKTFCQSRKCIPALLNSYNTGIDSRCFRLTDVSKTIKYIML